MLVAAGGPSYELSMLNLDTGNIEYLMGVTEAAYANDKNASNTLMTGMQVSSFHRESSIRDSFQWPEKQESNESLYKRYLMQTRSFISSPQIQLTQSLDE